MRLNNYVVIVSNIGHVYDKWNSTHDDAKVVYEAIVYQSQQGFGRAAGEDVTLLMNGEIYCEHVGYNNMQDEDECNAVTH
jgi:hypothetical protein